jgi:hypothetical protein
MSEKYITLEDLIKAGYSIDKDVPPCQWLSKEFPDYSLKVFVHKSIVKAPDPIGDTEVFHIVLTAHIPYVGGNSREFSIETTVLWGETVFNIEQWISDTYKKLR